MIRRLFLATLLAVLAGCGSPASPSKTGTATLTSITLAGQTTFSLVGQTSQLTARAVYSNGTNQDATSLVVWSMRDPSIATISAGGLVKTVGYGSTSVTATLQSRSASLNIQVNMTASGFAISTTNVALSAVGQTAQVTATANLADGSTKDVTTLTAWSSDATQIASIDSTGLVTASALGLAHIAAKFAQFNKSILVTVTPPGTFVAAGRTRDPGSGGLSGVTIVHQPSGQSTSSSNSSQNPGGFTLGGLTDGTLSFDRSGYESASVDTATVTGTTVKYFDVPMQPITRISVGTLITRTIAPHDMDYVVAPEVHCYPCQLVRVTTATSGTLHLQVSWSEPHSTLSMWINGIQFPGTKTGPSSVSADLPADPGEVLVYVGQLSNENAYYVTFTLNSEMR